MPSILVRDLDAKTIRRLKSRAKRNGRSLQNEAKRLIEQSTGSSDVCEMLDKWKKRFAGRKFSSSAAMLRKDRER
jgi:plasmid stability protein